MIEDIGGDPFVQPGAVHRGDDQECAYPELPNLEYIIDGGPTDDTVEVIKKYEEHLAYWVSEPDEGQTDALINGFNRASGDIFCCLCSDDLFESKTLQEVADIFTEHPDWQVVYGDSIWIDADRPPIR